MHFAYNFCGSLVISGPIPERRSGDGTAFSLTRTKDVLLTLPIPGLLLGASGSWRVIRGADEVAGKQPLRRGHLPRFRGGSLIDSVLGGR